MALVSNSLINRLARKGLMGATHGYAMNLFMILTPEEEIGSFRQNSSNVVMSCIDVGVFPRT